MTSGDASMDIRETCPPCFHVIILAVWLEAAVAIAANVLAIAAFFSASQIRQKVSNYFILNLSIADLLIGIVAIPLSNMMLYHGHWPYGKAACKVWLLGVYACTMLSGLALVLISWDRFLWVRAPLLYIHHQSRRRAACVIVTTATIVYAFVSVVDVGWEALSGESNTNYTLSCESEGVQYLSYAFLTFTLEFLLPAGLLATFNILVFVEIRRALLSRAKTKSGTVRIADECKDSSSGSGAGDAPSSARLSPGATAYRKSALMLGLMTAAFLLCWCPWFVVVFVNSLGGHVSDHVLWAVSYVMYANSAINPFLYASANVHYRTQMTSLVCFYRRR